MHKFSQSLSFVFLSAALGCGAPDRQETPELERPTAPSPLGAHDGAKTNESTSFQLTTGGNTQIEVIETELGPAIVEVGNDGDYSQLAGLAQTNATVLEAALFVDPQTRIPDWLADAHALDAAAMGRADTSIRNFSGLRHAARRVSGACESEADFLRYVDAALANSMRNWASADREFIYEKIITTPYTVSSFSCQLKGPTSNQKLGVSYMRSIDWAHPSVTLKHRQWAWAHLPAPAQNGSQYAIIARTLTSGTAKAGVSFGYLR